MQNETCNDSAFFYAINKKSDFFLIQLVIGGDNKEEKETFPLCLNILKNNN